MIKALQDDYDGNFRPGLKWDILLMKAIALMSISAPLPYGQFHGILSNLQTGGVISLPSNRFLLSAIDSLATKVAKKIAEDMNKILRRVTEMRIVR